jgi:hypothetical protein
VLYGDREKWLNLVVLFMDTAELFDDIPSLMTLGSAVKKVRLIVQADKQPKGKTKFIQRKM